MIIARCLVLVTVLMGCAAEVRAQPLAERRVALVIGNSAYRNPQVLPRLPNATNDSRAMACMAGSGSMMASDRGTSAVASRVPSSRVSTVRSGASKRTA